MTKTKRRIIKSLRVEKSNKISLVNIDRELITGVVGCQLPWLSHPILLGLVRDVIGKLVFVADAITAPNTDKTHLDRIGNMWSAWSRLLYKDTYNIAFKFLNIS